MKTETKLWIGLGIIILLTPLGLIAQGTAWGEWGSDEMMKMLGFIPEGFKRLRGLWKAPIADYSLSGWNEHPIKASIIYILSAIVGIGAAVAFIFGIGKLLVSKEEK